MRPWAPWSSRSPWHPAAAPTSRSPTNSRRGERHANRLQFGLSLPGCDATVMAWKASEATPEGWKGKDVDAAEENLAISGRRARSRFSVRRRVLGHRNLPRGQLAGVGPRPAVAACRPARDL